MTQCYYGETLRQTYKEFQVNQQAIYQSTQQLLNENKTKGTCGIAYQDAEYRKKSLYYQLKHNQNKDIQDLYKKFRKLSLKYSTNASDSDLEEILNFLIYKLGKSTTELKAPIDKLKTKYAALEKATTYVDLLDLANSIYESREYLQKHVEEFIKEYGFGLPSLQITNIFDNVKKSQGDWSDEEEPKPPQKPILKEEIKPTIEEKKEAEIKLSDDEEPIIKKEEKPKAIDKPVKSAPIESGNINIFKQIITAKVILDTTDVETKSLLFNNILQLIISSKSPDAIQGELLDMLGYQNIEAVEELLSKRDYIIKQYNYLLDNIPTTQSKSTNIGGLNEISRTMLFDDSMKIPPKKIVASPIAYKTYTVENGAQTEYKMLQFPEYEFQRFEINNTPDMSQYKLIEISSLPLYAQLCFENIKKLNPVQSICFEVAYNTTKNMLVCAPTSSGKTNVAVLAMLKEMSYYNPEEGLHGKPFKIIYVSPMKALAAELVDKFGKIFAPMGVMVRELTGDINLSKKEIEQSQLLVVTPEKLDVITRKTNSIIMDIGLLILDEIHLLHEKRGSVLESLIVRALNSIQKNQKALRIVGLSATLPNFNDVAEFIQASPDCTFHFDYNFRPTMLTQNFYGIKEKIPLFKQKEIMIRIAFNSCLKVLGMGKQVLVFVHSRKDTYNTGMAFIDLIKSKPETQKQFQSDQYKSQIRPITNSRNKQMQVLYPYAIGIHHAGMLRVDRSLMEKCFKDNCTRVLICTSTLAWGVNLPAYEVIILGTEYYNPEASKFEDIGILDLLQIFGRAGRPQFESHGEAIIITTQPKMYNFVRLLTHQTEIESNLLENLYDVLNAEISIGTITCLTEAIQFLKTTYLAKRIRKNPLRYNLKETDLAKDPGMFDIYKALIIRHCSELATYNLIKFDKAKEILSPTDLGKIASTYYLDYRTACKFMNHCMDREVLNLFSRAREFKLMRIRNEEMSEIKELCSKSQFAEDINGRDMKASTKVLLLLELYLCGEEPLEFSLISDSNYILQNSIRLMRGLFEICMYNKCCGASIDALRWTILIGKRMNRSCHPLWQFSRFSNTNILSTGMRNGDFLHDDVIQNLEQKKLSIQRLYEKDCSLELKGFLNQGNIESLYNYLYILPQLQFELNVFPVSSSILRIQLQLNIKIKWKDRWNGINENFWLMSEINDELNHKELISISKTKCMQFPNIDISFFLPMQTTGVLNIHVISERWYGVEYAQAYDLSSIVIPNDENPMTDITSKEAVIISDIKNEKYQQLYKHIKCFNIVQSNVFPTVYLTDNNILVGAPTGSGKTYIAELAVIRTLTTNPLAKAVYIAPLKALTQERYYDWKERFDANLGIHVEELTGDINPDRKKIEESKIIITTPEKWDGITRQWQERDYVKQVMLIIIDEVHLLGTERGGVLEAIVVRLKYIRESLGIKIRLVALSTALSNGKDVAKWLGVEEKGYYNFRQDVRPVPLNKYVIGGFSDIHYCPRMRSMNKPAYNKIRELSPDNPVIIFVSSRRQTRLTAMDLITFSTEQFELKKIFLHMTESELKSVLEKISDGILHHTLQYGIGIHHAGLIASDRKIMEELYLQKKIQVIIATSTLAWGVNFPARMVIIKGSEFFDPKTKRYVDYSLTDIMQMMGRAGRPQFDDRGEAVLFTDDGKAEFYRNFLNTPLPVESFLMTHLVDHINAEIVSGAITNAKSMEDYIKNTYLWIRICKNPGYYKVTSKPEDYLKQLVFNTYKILSESKLLEKNDEENYSPSSLGIIASNYYISYFTIPFFISCKSDSIYDLILAITSAYEFNELPVRHLEDKVVEGMNEHVPFPLPSNSPFNNPNSKAFILFQYYLSHIPLPIEDFRTDTFIMLNQVLRVITAFIEYSAHSKNINFVANLINIAQMVSCKQWIFASPIIYLLEEPFKIKFFDSKDIQYIPQIIQQSANLLKETKDSTIIKAINMAMKLPSLEISYAICGVDSQTIKPSKKANLKKNEEASLHLLITNKNHNSIPLESSKGRKDNWFILLVNDNNSSILKLIKVPNASQLTRGALFVMPDEPSNCNLKLYVMSDSFIGIDKVISINVQEAMKNVSIIDYDKEI